MAKILILMTKAKTLGLLDGRQHASGFWAEEFVVPYERFGKEGYQVDVATIGGEAPSPDQGSLSNFVVSHTRPEGSPDNDDENIANYRQVIDTLDALKRPMDVGDLGKDDLAGYDGVYISGGHGAMEDLPHSPEMTSVVRWILDLGLPLAVVCHGQSALLPLRDSHGHWPLEGYRMTAFSHDEEMVTDMAGQLPFVLQVELERLGAKYHKASAIWGSCVIEDRNLITGQNPYSSTAIAEALVNRLARTR
jgi:putative intracellular protease/amidase